MKKYNPNNYEAIPSANGCSGCCFDSDDGKYCYTTYTNQKDEFPCCNLIYVRKQPNPRTRPTSPDPSRKPWIEPFKVGDKVLIEGVVEAVRDGYLCIDMENRFGRKFTALLAPHQLKLSTNIQLGEK